MKKLILAALIAMTSGAAIAENEQIVFQYAKPGHAV